MASLYEIKGAYLQLMQMMDDADGDMTVIEDTLEAIEGELEEKAENYAKIIKEYTAEAEKFKAEKERLEHMQIAAQNKADYLKNKLYITMKEVGKTKFKTDLFSFGIQKNGGTAPLIMKEGIEVPMSYTKAEPDMAKIREALNRGEKLDFAELGERGEHLRIR
ncbi:MAG: siphovirus Gp157 family protein [Lachnospiraceae bacterium]|nr:siphovirus Gp157 family protein [Lachnospiraceae bacterium]MBP3543471.1 siphovirus Gp157 family protein [Lachnospiraceae bacterium]